MKSFCLLLILALVSLSSSNEIEDKIKCIVENKNIRKNVMNIINSIISKEDINTIISKIIEAYNSVKDDVKNCQLNSCEYLEEYECMEYCYRKYC